MNGTITVQQGNDQFYCENSEVKDFNEETKIICRHCGEILEDASNVYYQYDVEFCCEECAYEQERIDTLQENQDRGGYNKQ